ncbi:hypothetical protein M885DRAFT_568143 [Pelagophyceae sp. CCMP2097]|nr:hypothetical protein M885DRAFT_568143 [Pelagophyceae sp. CCMP2097]
MAWCFVARRRPGAPRAAARGFAVSKVAGAEFVVRNVPLDATKDTVRRVFAGLPCDVRSVFFKSGLGTSSRGATAYARAVTIQSRDCDAVRLRVHGSLLGGRALDVALQRQRTVPSAAATLNDRIIDCHTASDVLFLFKGRCADFTHVHLATALHRLGTLQDADASFSPNYRPRAMQLVVATMTSLAEGPELWEPRHVSAAAWGLSRVRASVGVLATAPLFEALAEQAVASISNFEARELSNVAYAYAKAGVEAPDLFGSIAVAALAQVKSFKSQEVANTVWAFATADYVSEYVLDLFEAIASVAPETVSDFQPQELTMIVWAYAKASVKALQLFRAVALEAPRQMAAFTPQALAITAWAYATAGIAAPALFDAVAAAALRRITFFTPRDISNILWAFAHADVRAPWLFRAAADQTAKQIDDFNPHITRVVWEPPPTTDRRDTRQDLGNALYAFSLHRPVPYSVLHLVSGRLAHLAHQERPRGAAYIAHPETSERQGVTTKGYTWVERRPDDDAPRFLP